MHPALVAAAAALVQFAAIATPVEAPAGPAFDLHGATDDGQPTDAPVFFGDGTKPHARIRFASPVDGQCIVEQVVHRDGKPMAAPLAVSQRLLHGESSMVEVRLFTPKDAADSNAAIDDYTIALVCGNPDDSTSKAIYSRFYRAPIASPTT